MAQDKDEKDPTSAQVRKGKHTKRPGEPVVENEPAASPLGTDDEAAGRPPESERVRSAVDSDPRAERPIAGADRHNRPTSFAWIGVVALLAFILLLIAALMLA